MPLFFHYLSGWLCVMDPLSKVLDLLHFDGTFYFAANFNGAWGVEVPQYKNVARFHYVVQGHCWVRINGLAKPEKLSPGDLIIIPHGSSHVLSDKADGAVITLDEAFAQESYDGQGVFSIGDRKSSVETQLVCGHFEFDTLFRHPLVDHLPQRIVANENKGMAFSWLKDMLHFMSHTATTKVNGSSALIKRLSEVIFIQSIRLWYESDGSAQDNTGFLAALNDQQLSKGLKAFHEDYAASWTVDKLAVMSSMSRSLFSDRFRYYLDMSPMQYVTQWRMQNAKKILKDTTTSVDSIATLVGYDSGPAFSKAFKREVGVNPGEYRRTTQLEVRD